MSAQATCRGFAAAFGYLYEEWRPGKWFEWRPWKWFDNDDEKFVLEALDRPKRKRLIASMSDERLARLGLSLVLLALYVFMGGGSSADVVLILIVLQWLEFEKFDARIKLLKLVDRMSSVTAARESDSGGAARDSAGSE